MKIKQTTLIRDKLLNDATSSDQDLIIYFVEVVNINEKTAKEYIASRTIYLNHSAFKTQKTT